MKNRIFAAICCVAAMLICQTANAQLMQQLFPSLEAETMDDSTMMLPQAAAGRITLVGMAYSKRSENDLSSWMAPVYQAFIRQKTGGSSLFSSFAHDIDVYFVPMFTGINTAAKGIAKRKAVQHLDQQLWPHVLFYKGKLKPYKEALEFEKRDVPYFFLLDRQGKIVYATSGAYSAKKMAEIEDIIGEL